MTKRLVIAAIATLLAIGAVAANAAAQTMPHAASVSQTMPHV